MSAYWIEKPPCIVPGMALHALLEAAAGTGKTYVIERLVLEMLLAHQVPIEKVLVVTFTRRAAAEMKGRIRACIEDLLAGKDAIPQQAQAWRIDAPQRVLLERALADFDQAPISTIHQFCQRVLDEQEILTGRLPSTSEIAPADTFREAFRDHLRSLAGTGSQADEVLAAWVREGCGTIGELEDALNGLRAQLDVLRPRLDDAVLAERHEALLTRLAAPLPLASTLKACGVELASPTADRALLAIQAHAVKCGLLDAETFARTKATMEPRAFQLGFLREMHPFLERPKNERELGFKFEHAEQLEEPARGLFMAVRDLYLAAPSAVAVAAHTLLPGAVERFDALCEARGVLDFDRLLSETERALQNDPQQHLARRLQARYHAVLVDEFQDTDPTQWSVFRLAFLSAQSKTRFIAVGDPKQAIYSFRGGDLATYASARDGDGTQPGLTQLPPLLRNWRSTDAMVKAYNRLLTAAPGGDLFLGDPKAGGVAYTEVQAARDVGTLELDGAPARPLGVLRIRCVKVGQGRLQLRAAVVKWARQLLERGTLRLPGKAPRSVVPADLMVLVDTNQQARDLVGDLVSAGVPAEQYRAAGLMKSAEAVEVLELLQALAHPEQPGSLVKALRTTFFDVSLDELETADALSPDDERLRQWNALVRAAEDRDWLDLFGRLRDGLGLRHRKSLTADTERALLTVNAVLDTAHQLARGGCRDIAALVAELVSLQVGGDDSASESDADIFPASEGPTAVRVLTVHKAKGLEAPIVFLAHAPRGENPNAEEVYTYHQGTERLVWVGPTRLFPKVEAQIALEEELEARRFQYVALTRARHQLWLPTFHTPDSPPKVPDPGQRYAATHTRLLALLEDPSFAQQCEVDEGPFSFAAPLAAKAPPKGAPPAVQAPEPHPSLVRVTARGLSIESFSSLTLPLDHPPEEAPVSARPKVGELAKGAAAGRAIHALLEDVPLEATKAGQSFDDWRAHDGVKALFARWRLPATLEHVQRLVFLALHTKVPLLGDAVVHGLGTLGAGLHREVPFDLQWPSAKHPFGAPVSGRWTIDRGFLTGVIDFAFEHRGRVYFGDWKSNCYERYDSETLASSVRGSYAGQVLIYTLALCRLHRIETQADYEQRFGGALYVYLRGLVKSGEGLSFWRPSWADLSKLDETLRAFHLAPEDRPKLSLVPSDLPVDGHEDDDEEEDS